MVRGGEALRRPDSVRAEPSHSQLDQVPRIPTAGVADADGSPRRRDVKWFVAVLILLPFVLALLPFATLGCFEYSP
jgi:hypothetical protein